MVVISLFDGGACGREALSRVGKKPRAYFASEIDESAITVAKDNFPDIIHIGNVEKVRYVKGILFTEFGSYYVPRVDLLIGGSPCQGFSNGGTLGGFEDPRSRLFFHFIRIKKEIEAENPELEFLLENVKMRLAWKNIISGFIGSAPYLINSALVSAQNRERFYWTNIKGVEIPEDRGVLLSDILDPEPDPKYLHTEKGIAYMSRKVKGGRSHWDFAHHTDINDKKSRCLVANTAKGLPYNCLRLSDDPIRARRFTPVECERLQGLPDNYTAGVSDTQRYRILGNGWQVNTIILFFKNIKLN